MSPVLHVKALDHLEAGLGQSGSYLESNSSKTSSIGDTV
jgi:hypothetical protein